MKSVIIGLIKGREKPFWTQKWPKMLYFINIDPETLQD